MSGRNRAVWASRVQAYILEEGKITWQKYAVVANAIPLPLWMEVVLTYCKLAPTTPNYLPCMLQRDRTSSKTLL